MKSWRSILWFIIRLCFSLALLWFAFRPIDWSALLESSQEVNVLWLLAALGLIIMSNTIAALRWGWIARRNGLEQSWQRYIAIYFAGGLINQGLPSTLGGDTYRALQSARRQKVDDGPALRYGMLCVILDRFIGLTGNIVLGSIGLILGGKLLNPWAQNLGWTIAIVTVSGILLAGLLLRYKWFYNRITKLLKLLHLPNAMAAVTGVFSWPYNTVQLAAGLIVHLLTLGCFAACLRAFGVAVPFEAVMIGLPALTLLMMLPISISGWGLRETTLSAVLLLWGVPAPTTVLASVSYGLIVIVCYLPASWFLIRNRPPKANPS